MLFNREKNPNLQTNSPQEATTVIGPSAQFEGTLLFQGAARIAGRFKGTVRSEDLLVIGENASVEGELLVGTLIIEGQFCGDVKATESISLGKTARVFAVLNAPNIAMTPGAIFEGECHMGTTSEAKPKPVSGPLSQEPVQITNFA